MAQNLMKTAFGWLKNSMSTAFLWLKTLCK